MDVLDWLTDHGALRLSDGSAENWAHDSERGYALYDIDHDVCASLFRPARLIQQLGGAAGLLDVSDISHRRSAQREATAQRARRLLVEHPVLYYATLDTETAAALRGTELADNLARLTGLVVERRAEGVMLVDPTGRFTDQPFPGRGGAVNRTAGLLLAKIADVLEDPDDGPTLTRIPVPSTADDLHDLLERIDSGMSWPPDRADWAPSGERRRPDAGPLEAPFVDRTRLERMLDETVRAFRRGLIHRAMAIRPPRAARGRDRLSMTCGWSGGCGSARRSCPPPRATARHRGAASRGPPRRPEHVRLLRVLTD